MRQNLLQVTTPGNVLLALGSLILARAFILGELLPYIYAFMAAFAWRSRERSAVAVIFALLGFGTVLSGAGLWSNMITVLVLVAVMTYTTIPENKSWWGLPVITAAVVFLTKTILLAMIEISFYQEMITVFEALLAGILTFVLMVTSEALNNRKALAKFTFEEMAAFVILGIGLVMGMNDIHILGLGVSSIICRIGILIAAYLWGSGGGTMVGVMSGIIPSIASSIFAQSLGMYALSGLLAGLFKNFGKLGVIIGFMLGNLAISMFIAENQVALIGIWETGIASLIFWFLPESLKRVVPFESLGSIGMQGYDPERVDSRIKASVGSRIQNLAEVFDELSSTFTTTYEQEPQPPSVAYLNYLYDELSNGFCEGCSRYRRCWEHENISTSQQLLDLFNLAEAEGQISYEKCSNAFKHKCLHGRELVSTINYLFDNLRMNEYWSGKIGESRELVAKQLKGVSQVVKNLAEEIEVETRVDYELRSTLLRECLRQGINLKDITPIKSSGEGLVLEVTAASCMDGAGCELSIAPAVSSIIGEKMEVCGKQCPRFKGQGACEFTLTRAFTYEVRSAVAQVSREDVSGDSYVITTLKEGKELLVLSDGMGVGEKASSQSQTAVNLLENLLTSGFDQEVALNTINSVLLLRSTTESFTTLDIVMIDLHTAEIDFIKTASAPSFIKRGRRVAMISSSSLPVGILDEVELVSEKKALLPRDIVLMISDGVMEASRTENGEEWIAELLADLDERDPQIIAEMIINQALRLANGKPQDDMTAICMKIELR
jgi:stage II sporulation protein E